MRLSEAIRLGAILKPQAFGIEFDGYGTCAVGAALDALGCLNGSSADQVDALVAWQADISGLFQMADCPACGRTASLELESTIPHLNDEHRWSRKRIADWVEQIEQQQEAAAAVPEAIHVMG